MMATESCVRDRNNSTTSGIANMTASILGSSERSIFRAIRIDRLSERMDDCTGCADGCRMRLEGERFSRHSRLSCGRVNLCCSTGCLGTITDRDNTLTVRDGKRRLQELVKAMFSGIGTDTLSRDDRTQRQGVRPRFSRLKNNEIPEANVRNVRVNISFAHFPTVLHKPCRCSSGALAKNAARLL